MSNEIETPTLIDTPIILTEAFTDWITGDFDASYIADNIGSYEDKHDMAIGVLGDWIPLYYIKNWKDIKPLFNKLDTEDGMPYGDWCEEKKEMQGFPQSNTHQFYYISEAHLKENEDERM